MYIQLLVTNALILESGGRNTQNRPCKYMYIVPSGEDNVSKYHIHSQKYCLSHTHHLSLRWEGNFYSNIFYDYSPVEKAVLCYKVDKLVALLPTFPSVCCLQYDVCKPLMPDILAPEAHQNGCLRGDGHLPRTIWYTRIYSTNCIEQCMQVIQAWE